MCLLLSNAGVPKAFVERLMEEEMQRLVKISKNRTSALKFVEQSWVVVENVGQEEFTNNDDLDEHLSDLDQAFHFPHADYSHLLNQSNGNVIGSNKRFVFFPDVTDFDFRTILLSNLVL